MNYKLLIISIFMALPIGIARAADFDVKAEGRALTEAFYAGEVDTVWERFNAQMRGALGSKEKFAAFAARIDANLGAEAEVLEESVETMGPYAVYQRVVRFEKAPMKFQVQWAFEPDGQVSGFFIKPATRQTPQAAPTDFLDYRTKTDLRLPFDGEWYVFWGGKKLENNYHAASVDQRFAYDILVMRAGSTHSGDGAQLGDYYCWGQPILAPAGGTVAVAVDQWPDNAPGERDPEHAAGNYVVIDHGNGEFSFLAHLQQGSVAVEEGQAIEAGDRVGLCGNSGNTTEPHLHYHLQTTPKLFEGKGLPAQFQNYLANGEFVERGIPIKGQRIKAAEQPQ